MAKVTRHQPYELIGGQGTITLKKWSAAKLFGLVRDFGSILESALGNVDEINIAGLIQRLVGAFCDSEERAVRIIKDSIAKPELTQEQILDWDAEDFIAVLAITFEMNITEGVSKNFQRLLNVFVDTEELKKKVSQPEG